MREVRSGQSEYPDRLRDLASAPDPVYLAGRWDHPGPSVAIVGTRDPDEDGRDLARGLAGALARRGVAILSGLARGIDAAAHEGALEAGGPTGAVLGTPLDKVYPPGHATLQRNVRHSLGLMSEIPLGGHATPNTFAARNRMLAALADLTVVVQGRRGSGALLTAEAARRLGRPVGGVPWDPGEPRGEAPNALIHDGHATLIRGVEDVLEILGLAAPPPSTARPRVPAPDPGTLPPHERALYGALRRRPRSLDELALAAGLTAPQLGTALVALELSGLALRLPGGSARRRG